MTKPALAPIVVAGDEPLHGMLSKEWLRANRIGAYASSTPAGCNTRRYHGLLVAATVPPVGRLCALSSLGEQVEVNGQRYDLATNEFDGTFAPRGVDGLVEFRDDVAATFIYRVGGLELTKEVLLAERDNAVAIRYTLRGGAARMTLWPFAALRDFHGLRRVHQPHQMTFESMPHGVVIKDLPRVKHTLHIVCPGSRFTASPQWWYRFVYRADLERGQDGIEDLYTPGSLTVGLSDGRPCQVTASLDGPTTVEFDTTLARRRERLTELDNALGDNADETARRLAVASDSFVVQRDFPDTPPQPTILAGFHWFADWGRDTFIALPGLLLETGRHDQARGVFRLFARSIKDGLVPNRFDDYSHAAHYNSLDASLWFMLAGERYLQATGDTGFFRDVLLPAMRQILTAFTNGTAFNIHADSDGLLTGGDESTQLTWMDAKLGGEAITPRHGKSVETNALWVAAHEIFARRIQPLDAKLSAEYAARYEQIGRAFVNAFWYEQGGYMFDVITHGKPDASVRPNQIIAAALPQVPLSTAQRASVVRVVREHLLTPLGLRTLSPVDRHYRPQCAGTWEQRDRAYHQGTVWPWLIGFFIEAYLLAEGRSDETLAQARSFLDAFDDHMRQSGLGFINEIADGNGPHTPRGCIAQAWSVAEVLRAKRLVE